MPEQNSHGIFTVFYGKNKNRERIIPFTVKHIKSPMYGKPNSTTEKHAENRAALPENTGKYGFAVCT